MGTGMDVGRLIRGVLNCNNVIAVMTIMSGSLFYEQYNSEESKLYTDYLICFIAAFPLNSDWFSPKEIHSVE